MSIKQLKDVINDIFIEKFKHDQRCLEARVQVETMEQFLYTYLSKKYGLKVSLIYFHNLKVTYPVPSLPRSVLGEGLPSVRRGCVPFRKMPEERVRPRIPISPSDRKRLNLSRLQMRASGKEPSGIRTGNSGLGRLLQAGLKLAREMALAPHTQQAL